MKDLSRLLFYFYITEFTINWIATVWCVMFMYPACFLLFQVEMNHEKLLAYNKYRYRLLHCRNLCLHPLSLRVYLITLYVLLYMYSYVTLGENGGNGQQKGPQQSFAACPPQPWPICTHTTIKALLQIFQEGGGEVCFPLAALSHCPRSSRAAVISTALGGWQHFQCQTGSHTACFSVSVTDSSLEHQHLPRAMSTLVMSS